MNSLTHSLGVVVLVVGALAASAQVSVTLTVPTAGDAQYEWNSRYGGDGYSGVGANTLEASNSFYAGIPTDTQYTVGIFMVPLAPLAGRALLTATLTVNSAGFTTTYSSGSALLGWLNTGSVGALTGDVVADGLGPLAKSRPGNFTIDADAPNTGPLTFNVATYLQQDIDAGRSFSTFVLSTSRDTFGSIASAESGLGPYVTATVIPEPWAAALVLGLLGGGVVAWRRWSGA